MNQMYIGRDEELGLLQKWLDGDRRLITITGTAGIGKTALVRRFVEAVAEEEGSVLFVPLSSAEGVEDLLRAISEELGRGTLVGGPEPEAGVLARALESRRVRLLVLDQVEQLLPAAVPVVEQLLVGTAKLLIVATSRLRLQIEGEQLLELSPLSFPPVPLPENRPLDDFEACRLMCARLRKLDPDFEVDDEARASIAEITHRLEGLPLAIELAAPRCRLMGLRAMTERLEKGRSSSACPDRFRLYDALETSWLLLNDEERHGLAALTAFAAPFRADLAEELLRRRVSQAAPFPLEILQCLRDHSLLNRDEEGKLFFFRIVRDFAEHQTREDPLIEQGLHEHARLVAEEAAAFMKSFQARGDLPSLRGLIELAPEVREALNRLLDGELAEISDRWALVWPLLNAAILVASRWESARRRAQLVATMSGERHWERIVDDAPPYVIYRLIWLFTEEGARERGGELLESWKGEPETTCDELQLDLGRILLAKAGGNHEKALRLAERWRKGEENEDCAFLAARLFGELGIIYYRGFRDKERARQMWEEGWRRMQKLGAVYGASLFVANLCLIYSERGDPVRSEHYGEQALEIFEELGDRRSASAIMAYLGRLDKKLGRYQSARRRFEEALEHLRWSGQDHWAALAHANLAEVAILLGDAEFASVHLAASDQIFHQVAPEQGRLNNDWLRAELFVAMGRLQDAALQWEGLIKARQVRLDVLSSRQDMAALFLSWASLGSVRAVLGEEEKAREAFGECRHLAGCIHDQKVQEAYRVRSALCADEEEWPQLAVLFARLMSFALGERSSPPVDTPPGWHNSLTLRRSVDFVWPRLSVRRRQDVEARVRDPEGRKLLVTSERTRFRGPGETQWCDIGARKRLVELLDLLVDARKTGRVLDQEALRETLWPEERITPKAAKNRIHNAVSMLRSAGLGPLLSWDEQRGYCLDSAVELVEVEGAPDLPKPAANWC